jgi:hypothetical protein
MTIFASQVSHHPLGGLSHTQRWEERDRNTAEISTSQFSGDSCGAQVGESDDFRPVSREADGTFRIR